jgi:hypothetical protein
MRAAMTDHSRLQLIFDGQRRLIDKFYPIEVQTLGINPDIPVDLQSHRGQARVKECAGRISEEVVELLEARRPGDQLEETADVLCFLMELFHVIGITPDEFAPHCGNEYHDSLECIYNRAMNANRETERLEWYDFLGELWAWMHELKAKPWKLNPKPTDVATFKEHARWVFLVFIRVCDTQDTSEDDLYEAYFRKHRINLERIAGIS